VRPERPINADVPASERQTEEEKRPEPGPKPSSAPAPAAAPEPSGGGSRPLTPIVLGALVVLALVFIVAAILGGSGGGESTEAPAPAPAPANTETRSQAPASQAAESLGYPTFATSNTTRVGGSDAAATAAGVALAVFPSTTPAQRPAAVTLVGEDDWAGAIAASVLMATPVRAPILFSGSGGLPDPSAEAFEALRPAGSDASGGASLFAIGEVALPSGAGKVTRVDSGDAASTAAQIATLRDQLFGSPPQHVLIAPAESPEFAMPAAAWAARSGDPVLFADAKQLPQPTAQALQRHAKVPVYVLGPASAISAAVLKEIAKIDPHVTRVAGKEAATNALALARFHDGSFGWNVNDPGHGFVLARSDEPLAAAAAAPLSASGTWGPLLLSEDAATLPSAVRSYLLYVKPGYTTDPTRAFYNHVWVIGDQEAIDVNQQAEVNELVEVAKIGGGE
jgi:hypothetical protein